MLYDINKLNSLVEKGFLVKYDNEDLLQYCLSPYTLKEGIWNRCTLFNCGNVYDRLTGELVAKAIPKFFELGDLPESLKANLRYQQFNATKMYDGSLAIIYKYSDEIRVNTLKGFTGKLNDLTLNIIKEYELSCLDILNLVVEVISPYNRNIIDYEDTIGVRVITAYYKVTGTELSPGSLKAICDEIGIPMVETEHIDWDGILDYAASHDINSKGYVLRFNGDFRVKIFNQAYKEACDLKSSIDRHSIWQLLKDNSLFEFRKIIANYPSILHYKTEHIAKEILDELSNIKIKAKELYEQTKDLSNEELRSCLQDEKEYIDLIIAYRKDNYDLANQIALKMLEPEMSFN